MRDAVQEVGGPVQGIDHPGVLRTGCPFTVLLAEHAVVGIHAQDGVDDHVLSLPVDLGDQVVAALLLDGERIYPVHRA